VELVPELVVGTNGGICCRIEAELVVQDMREMATRPPVRSFRAVPTVQATAQHAEHLPDSLISSDARGLKRRCKSEAADSTGKAKVMHNVGWQQLSAAIHGSQL
jgi:hypothetical protein